ncbi:hypothetical protein QFC22_004254 [Naganishia vaughanmartiniae]|uniref:Uncharacterized protein n=1 Tax=Naganishia vaughanmartiniae TaxID=1424756 RepID=A0ACC2X3N3_9TREE|nr:hypothetical protein QFC22_004254 [Naganishia vaughanmartiniae]
MGFPSASLSSTSTPAPRFLLPKNGTCPSCATRLEWGEIIRGCYARRDGEIDSVGSIEKETIKAAKKQASEEKKRLKALEKAATKKGKGRGAALLALPEDDVDEQDEMSNSDDRRGSEDDEDDENMRSMVRGWDTSENSMSSDDDSPAETCGPTKVLVPAKTRGKATVVARRGRGRATAGKPATTRSAKKKTKAATTDEGGSESEGTRLNREMMMMTESD